MGRVEPVRILHITPYYADAWAYGGIPRLASAMARGLARRTHQVTVCTTDVCDGGSRLRRHDGADGRFTPWPAIQASDGVTVQIFPNLSNLLAYQLQLFVPLGLGRYLRTHARRFDIAHVHACHHLLGAAVARYLSAANVPYVLAPNGTAPRIERRLLPKYFFEMTLGRNIIPRAARLLAVTDAERRQLIALGVEPARIRIVPNPLDLSEFDDPIERGRFRRQFEWGAEAIVLFLGKLTPRKRVDMLVHAFATLQRPCRLVIAGNDLGSGPELQRLVQQLGVGSRTTFTGLLKGRDRLEALADADVVAYPSKDEIFGLVPLEALLCGTPVIVADDSGCGEVVGITGGGVVIPHDDASALAAAIEQILDEAPRWRKEAAEASVRVREKYSAETVCRQLEQVYEEVRAGDSARVAQSTESRS